MRTDMYNNIQDFSFSNIDKFSTAGLVTRLTTDVMNIQSAFMMIIRVAIRSLNQVVQENLSGIRVVKGFAREEYEKEKFQKTSTALYRIFKKAEGIMAYSSPVMQLVVYLCLLLIYWVGASIIVSSHSTILTTGELSSLIAYAMQILTALMMLSVVLILITIARSSGRRICEVLDEEPEIDEGYVTLVNARKDENGELTECAERTGIFAWKHPHHDGTLTYTELKGDIRMFDVDFGYVPEKIVLHNIKLYAEPGQKLAFVGATGAGKTTITNLLNRFYDIADGKIRYDGININKIRKDDLRRSIGLVLQDTNLFTGTVLENIRYGRLDATDDECVAAAKLAGADSFISNLPYGYYTVLLNAGAALSQGQRQLLDIARAVAANPPCMILDEATSSIDTRTERIVQEGMDALMKGRTSFVIAHRLSTIRNSDVIMVLDHGRIIERGSHEKLIEEKGTYYQLYTGAFELE